MSEMIVALAESEEKPRRRPQRAGVAPFTIKAFPIETRELIRRTAHQQGVTLAAWIDRAAHAQLALEAGQRPAVLPPEPAPSAPPQGSYARETAVASVNYDQFVEFHTGAGMSGMAGLVQAVLDASTAANAPVSKRFAGRVKSLTEQQMRLATLTLKRHALEAEARLIGAEIHGQTLPQSGIPETKKTTPYGVNFATIGETPPQIPRKPPELPKRAPLAQRLRAEREKAGASG